MQNNWEEFLLQQGAVLEQGQVNNFGNPVTEAEAVLSDNIITDLSCFSVVEISGNDAEDFLHGQFTSDIKQLEQDTARISAWCNPAGRVIADFLIIRRQDKYLLLLPVELQEPFTRRLQMFILRADVTMNDRSNEIMCIGLRGENIPQILQSCTGLSLEKEFQGIKYNGMFILPLPDQAARALILGSVEQLQNLWMSVAAETTAVSNRYWKLFDMLNGLHWVNSRTSENFMPQNLNLDCLGAVNYQKGCFPGQEVIARLHYRSNPKNRMYLAHIAGECPARPGDKLFLSETDASAGTIIELAEHPGTGTALLASINIELAGSSKIHISGPDGPVLSIDPLPYSFEQP